MRREVTVELSSQGFWKTGIRSDVCQVTLVNSINAQTLTHAYMLQYVLMDLTRAPMQHIQMFIDAQICWPNYSHSLLVQTMVDIQHLYNETIHIA